MAAENRSPYGSSGACCTADVELAGPAAGDATMVPTSEC